MPRERTPALLALLIPVLAGITWLTAAGAPPRYALVNFAALVLACLWIAFGRGPHTAASRHLLAGALLLAMLAPIWIGPGVASTTQHMVHRWLPFGPLALHAGMVALPALCMLAARNRQLAAPLLLAAALIALFQPDAGSGFAITFAAVGLHHVTRDWRVGLVAIAAFFASLRMVVTGELLRQPFVEGVLVDAFRLHWSFAVLLATALLGGFLLVLFALPFDRAKRFTLAGLLFGFVIAALMAPYPTPLIGYGAAPILGFGLALGLHRIPQR